MTQGKSAALYVHLCEREKGLDSPGDDLYYVLYEHGPHCRSLRGQWTSAGLSVSLASLLP